MVGGGVVGGTVPAGQGRVNLFPVAVECEPVVRRSADQKFLIDRAFNLLIEHGGGPGGELLSRHSQYLRRLIPEFSGNAAYRGDGFARGICQRRRNFPGIHRRKRIGEDDPAVLKRRRRHFTIVQFFQADFL